MKKVLSLLITLCLLWSCSLAEETTAAADSPAVLPSLWTGGETHTIEKKAMPLYIASLESMWPKDFPVYFTDGASDLPWLDLRDFAEFLSVFYSEADGADPESTFTATVDEARDTVTWMRRESDVVLFDFVNQQIL